jgi:hypothetical protein
MDRTEFLRKALLTFLVPTKSVYNVSVGEAKHVLENFSGIYITRKEVVDILTAEGFIYRPHADDYHGKFRANYACPLASLLNQHWTRDHVRIMLRSRRDFEKWDSVCDAIVVLKHMFLSSHGKFNVGNVDTAVSEVLLAQENNAVPESDPVAV